MRRTIIIYGAAMAALVSILKLIEYRFLVRDIPFEIYIGVIALMFTGIGVWAGLRLRRPKIVEVEVIGPFQRDDAAVTRAGISKRELEVLELAAVGLSNREIAERLFVSTATVKTHISNILGKLEASRRTEAIARAKEMKMIE